MMWIQTIAALLVVSAMSLVGAGALLLRRDAVRRGLIFIISFAAGAMLGDAFLHLLPEVAESPDGFDFAASMSLLGGVVTFFILEKTLHWHHSHIPHEEVMHPVAVTNLVGDGLHNFVDGAIVAASFAVSPELGIATTVAIALHEIPQELGDFAILLHAGLKPRKAMMMNFISALAALAGGLLTLAFIEISAIERVLVPFSAGAFVYIASTDLIPELHKEPEPRKSVGQVAALLSGVGVMALLLLLE